MKKKKVFSPDFAVESLDRLAVLGNNKHYIVKGFRERDKNMSYDILASMTFSTINSFIKNNQLFVAKTVFIEGSCKPKTTIKVKTVSEESITSCKTSLKNIYD